MDSLQNKDHNNKLCKDFATIDCEDDYDLLTDNVSISINNQMDLPGDIDDYDVLAIDRLPRSRSIKNLANPHADEDNKIQEPVDNTLNEDLNQPNSDNVIRQDNVINKKRLVSYIVGIFGLFIGTALLIVLLWYKQLKLGIEIPSSPIEAWNSTDLITYTFKYENITDADDIVTKVDPVSVTKQVVSDKPDVNVVDWQNNTKNRTMFSTLFKAKFDFKNKFNMSCMQMLLVKDKIWCANGINLDIYNTYSMIREKVEFPIKNAFFAGLAHAHTGHIILATSNKGLFKMHESGKNASKIVGGSFNGICCLHKKLYATSVYSKNYVVVFQHQSDRWIRVERKKINVTRIQSLLSNGNHLYICTRDMVYVYDNMMVRVDTISTAHFKPGIVSLCAVDKEGSILLVHSFSRSIFIGNGKEKWHKISIALDETRVTLKLRYAALDWLNSRMWVTTSYGIYTYDIIV